MQATESVFVKKLPRMGICAAAGLALTLVLLYAAAALTAAGMVDIRHASSLVAGSTAAGTLAAGFAAARPTGRQILPVGLTVGGMYIVLLFSGALFFPGRMTAGSIAAIAAAAIAGACLGALTASMLPGRR